MLIEVRCILTGQNWINGGNGYKGKEITVRQMIASYLNASVDGVVLIENSSGAINAILRSLPLKRGDILIDFSTAYPPFKVHITPDGTLLTILQAFYSWLQASIGIQIVEIPIVFPLKVRPFCRVA